MMRIGSGRILTAFGVGARSHELVGKTLRLPGVGFLVGLVAVLAACI